MIHIWRAYQKFWRESVKFHGKTDRHDYWWPVAWNVGITWILKLVGIGFLVGAYNGYEEHYRQLVSTAGVYQGSNDWRILLVIGSILLIAETAFVWISFLPRMSLMIRRLNDAGRSSWLVIMKYAGVILAYLGVFAKVAHISDLAILFYLFAAIILIWIILLLVEPSRDTGQNPRPMLKSVKDMFQPKRKGQVVTTTVICYPNGTVKPVKEHRKQKRPTFASMMKHVK